MYAPTSETMMTNSRNELACIGDMVWNSKKAGRRCGELTKSGPFPTVYTIPGAIAAPALRALREVPYFRPESAI
jgi:hypothetical protein